MNVNWQHPKLTALIETSGVPAEWVVSFLALMVNTGSVLTCRTDAPVYLLRAMTGTTLFYADQTYAPNDRIFGYLQGVRNVGLIEKIGLSLEWDDGCRVRDVEVDIYVPNYLLLSQCQESAVSQINEFMDRWCESMIKGLSVDSDENKPPADPPGGALSQDEIDSIVKDAEGNES